MRHHVDYESFAHGADIGVRGCGHTEAEAFANAARALTAVVTDPETVARAQTVEVSLAASDLELLFVGWLNEIVYEMATRHMLFSGFEVRLAREPDGWRLQACLRGEPVDGARHHPAVEVKGATFTALEVRRTDGRWCAQCVVDV
jgi:SHS2 domain-containing protein